MIIEIEKDGVHFISSVRDKHEIKIEWVNIKSYVSIDISDDNRVVNIQVNSGLYYKVYVPDAKSFIKSIVRDDKLELILDDKV